MNHWTYGLIEIKGELIVAELYFNESNGLTMYIPIMKKDLVKKEDRHRLSNDLINQLKLGIIYTEGDLHNE